MHRKTLFVVLALGVCLAFPAPVSAAAVDLEAVEKRVTLETLDNGFTVLIYERPTAPVVSFFTHVDVGSAQEVPGITGLAHMFEHMAFKGTSTIGTKNYKLEKKALERVDRAYDELARERRLKGSDPSRLEELETALKAAQEEAGKFVVPNQLMEIIERQGGVDVNAFTNADTTGYTYALPANKVELWALLESERFLDPVFREFYKERDVVQEERRQRTESQPVGRMLEQFQMAAFTAHPYGHSTVGYMSDLQSFTREDAQKFYATYYVPSNMTAAIVGDVKAAEVLPIVRRYFGRLPAGPEPPALRTVEPESISERTVTIPEKSQPVYVEGYHRPAQTHDDDAIYNVMADILSTGRDSRLYKSLVVERIAMASGAFNGYPGSKYPHVMIFWGMTSRDHTNEEVQQAIRTEIRRITTEPVSAAELEKVKTRAKADLIRGMASNDGIAEQLATYQAQYGDWRELFRSVERIEAVTEDDILRVARAAFTPTNRTVAMIVNEESPSSEKGTP